jgi:benzylsuccinate CoA-transferase BbsF subunit
MPLPLAGIRVISLGVGAVIPELCRIMGEFGADVIKVESRVNVDFMRRIGRGGPEDVNGSPGFNESNRNKRSIAVNLKTKKGQEIVRRLVKISDVVAENNRAHVVQGWGLDYESVRQLKPDIIYISSQGFGRGGPYEDFQTFGPNLAPAFGLTYLWGHPDDPYPIGGIINHPDHLAGKQGLVAVLAALDYRRRTGKGQYIDMSQIEVGTAMMGELYLEYTINGRDPKPMGNRSRYAAPHGAYRCRGDDRWCVIAVQTEEEWRRFCQAIGGPAWTQSPRFATLVERLRHVDELDALVETWTREHTPEEVMEILQAAGVAAGYVQNAEDHINDPHLRARGGIIEMDHPVVGPQLYPVNPIRLSETPAGPSVRPPLLGEHTEEICRDLLGMSDDEIRELTSEQVIGF